MNISPAPRAQSSTPPSHQQRAAMSPPSSPLPSPSQFFSKREGGALISGSKAVQVPEGVFTGFATAGSLIKSRQLNLDAGIFPAAEKPKGRRKQLAEVDANADAPKKSSKRSTKALDTKNRDAAAKKPRKRKEPTETSMPSSDTSALSTTAASVSSPKLVQEAVSQAPTKSKPKPKPRKQKVPKDKPETQTKLKKGKITKPGTITKASQGSATSKDVEFIQEYTFDSKTTGAKSTHFLPNNAYVAPSMGAIFALDAERADTSPLEPAAPVVKENLPSTIAEGIGNNATDKITMGEKAMAVNESLSLEAAVKRRIDWTPTKDTAVIIIEDGLSDTEQAGGSSEVQKKPALSSILANYTYADTVEVLTTETNARHGSGEALTKRRRIELVGIPAMHTNSAAITRMPKKKVTTITDLVTEQYRSKNKADVPSGFVSSFFGPREDLTLDPETAEHQKQPLPIMPPRKRASRGKSPTKAGTKKVQKERPKLAADKLLSPGSAASRLNRQEILFGTSSQLARDESPRFIRQIQQAIRESEEEAAAPTHHQSISFLDANNSLRSKKLSTFTTRRALWSVAARDDEDKLLEPDDIFWNNTKRESEKQNSLININAPVPVEEHDSGFYSIEDFAQGSPRSTDSTSNSTAARSISQLDGPADEPDQSSFYDIDAFQRTEVGGAQETAAADAVLVGHTKLLEAREVRATKSKASKDSITKKPRGRPPKATAPAPLKKLKAAKALPKKKTQTTGDNISGAIPCTPVRKKKTLDFVHIDEIQDSEAESPFSPSPPRKALAPNVSSPLKLVNDRSLVQAKHNREASEKLELGKLKAEKLKAAEVLRAAKAEAVRLVDAALRQDLYPKITAAVKGAPRTTNPSKPSWYEKILMYDPIVLEDLTAWLNAQGVRWPVTVKRKGKGKKKASEAAGDEDDMEVVEKELEAKWVQKWCEENSICCLYGEGKKHW